MTTSTKPRFTHDCARCRFLGFTSVAGRYADLYYCGGREKTVIARYSDDGPDYASGLPFGYGKNPELTVAVLQALKLGFLTSLDLPAVARDLSANPCSELLAVINQSIETDALASALKRFFANADCAEAERDLQALVRADSLETQARLPHIAVETTLTWAQKRCIEVAELLGRLKHVAFDPLRLNKALYSA